jgi:prevent-host-death family protein
MFYDRFMEQIGVRELNQNTSQVLARVSGGETVEVTDRGRPIARLVPVSDDRSVLSRLVAAGRATAPTVSGPIPLPPQLGDESIDVAQTVADLRDEERW